MAKKEFTPGTLLCPVPAVLVSCGMDDSANMLTIAWTGIVSTKPPMTYISVRKERHSYNIIKENMEFIINLPTKDLVRETDKAGVKSGKNIDKFKELKLTKEEIPGLMNSVAIKECPVSIGCKVKQIIELGSHDMFLSEIVSLNVDEKIIDENGRIDLAKANLFAYSHGDYFSLGQKIGSFGFSVRKKKK